MYFMIVADDYSSKILRNLAVRMRLFIPLTLRLVLVCLAGWRRGRKL